MTIHDLACAKIAAYERLPKNAVIASHLMTDLDAEPDTDWREVARQLMPMAVARAVSSTRVTMRPLADELRNTGKHSYQPSAWVKHAQSAREELLNEFYPDAHGERKRLALFTPEDLDALTKRLARKRDAIEAQRTRFAALKVAMERSGASMVAELSDTDLADAIDR